MFSGVPAYFQVWVFVSEYFCQSHDFFWLIVSTHEAEAGDGRGILVGYLTQSSIGKGVANVVPKPLAVASGAAVWAVSDVDGKGYFVGNLLKDNIVVAVSQHWELGK